jgi:hypothetical protein
MPDITMRRNSEDDNVLEDEEEAAEDEAALDLTVLDALFD